MVRRDVGVKYLGPEGPANQVLSHLRQHPVGKNKRFERWLDDANPVVDEDRIERIVDALWLGGPDWTARRDENASVSSSAS